ncbi:MAG: ribosome silencing factor [Alkalilacustris sp.]
MGRIIASLEDDKAEDIVTIDLQGRSSMADAMVVATGRSSRQVAAISEKLVDRLKSECGVIARTEGRETGDWVLIDAGDVVVHVFRPEVRDFYQIEKMWQPGTAPRSGE